MAHTKKKIIAKFKRKMMMRGKISDSNERAKFEIAGRINNHLENLIKDLENRIQFFKKEIINTKKKLKNIKSQEEKAAEKVIQSEHNLTEIGTPAAHKRLKVLKASNNKLSRASLMFSDNLTFLESELEHLNHQIHHINIFKKIL